jgi:hypothetical protein
MAIASVFTVLIRHVSEHSLSSFALSIIAAPLIYVVINEFIRYNARIGTLKGPRGLPLVGNLWDIRINAAEKYREWARQYGDVYQIQLGNIPVVVVNSAAAAKVLFSQNAQALSSRPELYTFHKVIFARRLHFAFRVLGAANIGQGTLRHCGHYNRHLAVQRVPQASTKGRSIGPQQAVHPNVHFAPGY